MSCYVKACSAVSCYSIVLICYVILSYAIEYFLMLCHLWDILCSFAVVRCGSENLWPQFRGKLISRFVPSATWQAGVGKVSGRFDEDGLLRPCGMAPCQIFCLGCLPWLQSSPEVIHWAVGARLMGWRPVLAKSPLRRRVSAWFHEDGGAIHQLPAPWYRGRCWSASAYSSGDTCI